MAKRKQTNTRTPEQKKKIEIEFFSDVLPEYQLNLFKSRNSPTAFNGMAIVKKYKLVIEEIEEPKEVIIARCQKIFNEDGNMHNRDAVKKFVQDNYGILLKNTLEVSE